MIGQTAMSSEQGSVDYSGSVKFNAPAKNPCALIVYNPQDLALTFTVDGKSISWYGLQMAASVQEYFDEINTRKTYTLEPETDHTVFYFGSLALSKDAPMTLSWEVTAG